MLLPRYFSPFQRHHYRSLNDTSCTFPWNLHALPLFFPYCLTFPVRNDHSRAQRISAAWHFSSFTQLHTKTALHPAPPLFLLWTIAPGCFSAFNCCISFSLRLTFSAVFCVCCFVLARVPCFFFACQFSRNYPCQFFRGGAFLYSGFNFSHSDLPFPTRCCIPYVRSGLYQLVIRVKGFRVCALHCDLAITSITHCIIRFCPSVWTPRFQRIECVSLVHGPRWLFLLSRHHEAISAAANQKPFVNKDL